MYVALSAASPFMVAPRGGPRRDDVHPAGGNAESGDAGGVLPVNPPRTPSIGKTSKRCTVTPVLFTLCTCVGGGPPSLGQDRPNLGTGVRARENLLEPVLDHGASTPPALATITISATKARIVNETTLMKRRVGAKTTPSDANMVVWDVITPARGPPKLVRTAGPI